MKDAKGHGSDPKGGTTIEDAATKAATKAAHQIGVESVPKGEVPQAIQMNPISTYTDAGERAGRARRQGDEAAARFHSDWSKRAIGLESGSYKRDAQAAFDMGYRKGSGR